MTIKNMPAGTKAGMFCSPVKSNPIVEGGMRFTFPPYDLLAVAAGLKVLSRTDMHP
jgi:hypothetical protein